MNIFITKSDIFNINISIMGLMMLAAGRNSKVKFIANGADAVAMLAELEALFARKFDEV